jgi:hypothetical protein
MAHELGIYIWNLMEGQMEYTGFQKAGEHRQTILNTKHRQT